MRLAVAWVALQTKDSIFRGWIGKFRGRLVKDDKKTPRTSETKKTEKKSGTKAESKTEIKEIQEEKIEVNGENQVDEAKEKVEQGMRHLLSSF